MRIEVQVNNQWGVMALVCGTINHLPFSVIANYEERTISALLPYGFNLPLSMSEFEKFKNGGICEFLESKIPTLSEDYQRLLAQ